MAAEGLIACTVAKEDHVVTWAMSADPAGNYVLTEWGPDGATPIRLITGEPAIYDSAIDAATALLDRAGWLDHVVDHISAG